MTLDDVVATMRERFTPQDITKPVTETTITAEEWMVLAQSVALADLLEQVIAEPNKEQRNGRKDKDLGRNDELEQKAAALIRRVRSGR